MNIYLTFDVEIWCGGWDSLDQRFPSAYKRYIYGKSEIDGYALPKTLEIMDRHGVRGTFFVEPLFAARFGIDHLAKIVELLKDARQDVQLHLHPEWTDEIRPPVFPHKPFKRQHLTHYSLDEQIQLIHLGLSLLKEAGAANVRAFRSGSFAANADTLDAVKACGLSVDASLNMCLPISGQDLRQEGAFYFPRMRCGLQLLPLSVFRDGFGRLRHAQVGACSARELREAIEHSFECDHPCFTILSHNFEMLRPGRVSQDEIVVRRFAALCRYLAEHSSRLPPCAVGDAMEIGVGRAEPVVQVGSVATVRRLSEQLVRRLIN